MRRDQSPTAIRTIEPEIMILAMKAAWACCPRDGMLLETLYETCIRNQEARLMLVGDLWRAGSVVLALIVRQEIAKGSRRRTIHLSEHFRARCRQYIEQVHGGPAGIRTDAPMFPSTRGRGHLTRRGVCLIVSKHLAAAGMRGTPHMIRHTGATELMRVASLRVVQQVLGHARLDTVAIYTHPTTTDMRAAAEARAAGHQPLQKTAPKNQANKTGQSVSSDVIDGEQGTLLDVTPKTDPLTHGR